jgi:hypothetical protein
MKLLRQPPTFKHPFGIYQFITTGLIPVVICYPRILNQIEYRLIACSFFRLMYLPISQGMEQTNIFFLNHHLLIPKNHSIFAPHFQKVIFNY